MLLDLSEAVDEAAAAKQEESSGTHSFYRLLTQGFFLFVLFFVLTFTLPFPPWPGREVFNQ